MKVVENDLRDALDSIRTCQYKSFFTKKLEHHLKDRAIKIPERIFAVFDKPFDEFTPEDYEIYEGQIKAQALFQIFSDMLVEIYESMNADRSGWEAAANFLKDTPMKLCSLYAMQKIEELEAMPECVYACAEDVPPDMQVSSAERKVYSRPYTEKEKSSRWSKKIF